MKNLVNRTATWIGSLFENEPKIKRKTTLDKESVKRCEDMIPAYSREIVMEYFGISITTYYHIKRGTHRYSTKESK